MTPRAALHSAEADERAAWNCNAVSLASWQARMREVQAARRDELRHRLGPVAVLWSAALDAICDADDAELEDLARHAEQPIRDLEALPEAERTREAHKAAALEALRRIGERRNP